MTKRTPNYERILTWHRRRDEGSAEGGASPASPDDDGSPLTETEIQAVVTLAHLMATADDAVSDEESDVFGALLAHFAKSPAETKRLEAFAEGLQNAEGSFEERARAAAAKLTRRSAKDRAYKAAYTVRVWDLEANPEEDELDEVIVEALGLSADDAAELAQQVNEALIIA